MDTVINKISEIESAATSIMEDANERKKAFAQEMAERTAAFDSQLEAETARKIEKLRAKMEIDMKAKLSKQKSDAEQILKMMEERYEANHKAYVKDLFQKMIEE